MSKKKKEYREGWLEFSCWTDDYTRYERRLSKFLTRQGCRLVGVVAKDKGKHFSLYYYHPQLLTRSGALWIIADLKLLHGGAWPQEHYRRKPWDLMSVEERKADELSEGQVLTRQEEEEATNDKLAEIILVLSQTSSKKQPSNEEQPVYNCYSIHMHRWDDKETTISTCRDQRTLCEIREYYNEDDLSFLVCYGAPRQILIDQIKKRRSKAQKQVDNWDKMLKRAEV